MSETYCPYCFATLLDAGATCPNCFQKLSIELSRNDSLPISIVGPKGAGKTHFIAVLIERIKRRASDFGWSFRAINDETLRLYNAKYRSRLYDPQNRYVVDKTQTGDRDAHAPLIYVLENESGAKNVLFYDTAGENFESEATMESRYMNRSRGIVFLIDPLQIPTIRNFLSKLNPDIRVDASNNVSPFGDIFNRMVTVLKKSFVAGKIPIPLAIVFAKIDALRPFVTDDAPFYLPSFHRRDFSRSDATRIHEYVARLAAYDADVLQLARRFERVAYFGVSALGQTPDDSGKLNFAPRPIRILDPFLWFLSNLGMISTR